MGRLGLVIVGLLSCLPMSAYAVKALDLSIHQEYTSTRALGMGNAFTAVVNDHSALFYNPAALARREDGVIRMFLRGGVDPKYQELIDDIDKAAKLPDAQQPAAYADLLQKNFGENYYFRIPTLGAFWARPNWGIAFIPADLSVDMSITQTGPPTLNVNAYLDTTLAWGYGRDLDVVGGGSRLSVGATIKAIHRANISQSFNSGDLALNDDIFDKRNANEGLTGDVDLGMLYTPKVGEMAFVKPTFAVVVRNLLDYGFPMNFNLIDKNSGEPPKLQRRVDLGSKLDLPKFWVFDPVVAVDVRDMLHENWSFKKGLHYGAELYWTMYNWWKGYWSVGSNQGYFTAGFGARFAVFQLDIATFGEEVGSRDVPKESRRYMVEMSLDF